MCHAAEFREAGVDNEGPDERHCVGDSGESRVQVQDHQRGAECLAGEFSSSCLCSSFVEK